MNLTENESIHEEIQAWKISFQMTNLCKILCFKNASRQGDWFVWFGVLLLLFTTLLSVYSISNISSVFFLSTKRGNVDLKGKISLLLSFPPVSGSKYCECPHMLLVLKTQQGIMT